MRSFSLLNLADLKLGLADLFTKRHTALLSLKVGMGGSDLLAFQRAAMDALPPALMGGRPLSEELGLVDDDHDGFGAAIWNLTEAYDRVPDADPALVAAASRIRAAFIPQLGDLQGSYADEAAAATQRKTDLVALKADLSLFPVAGGKTLYDWATSYVSAGEQLSVLLSQRADLNATTRKKAQVLRSETIGILNDLRRAVAREQQRNTTVPEDIDAQIFGYFETLEESRAAANRAGKNAKDEGKPSGG